jgi:hypothetical protein
MNFSDVVFALFGGVLFGALLQRAHVARFHVIINQLLLKDWTPAKLMLSAAAVGSVGLWMMAAPDVGYLRPQIVGRVELAVGAAHFGIGDALVGVIGMFFGAGLFAVAGNAVRSALPSLGNFGHRTWVDVTPVDNPAIYIAVLFLLAGAVALIDWRTPHVVEGDLDAGEPITTA